MNFFDSCNEVMNIICKFIDKLLGMYNGIEG